MVALVPKRDRLRVVAPIGSRGTNTRETKRPYPDEDPCFLRLGFCGLIPNFSIVVFLPT